MTVLTVLWYRQSMSSPQPPDDLTVAERDGLLKDELSYLPRDVVMTLFGKGFAFAAGFYRGAAEKAADRDGGEYGG